MTRSGKRSFTAYFSEVQNVGTGRTGNWYRAQSVMRITLPLAKSPYSFSGTRNLQKLIYLMIVLVGFQSKTTFKHNFIKGIDLKLLKIVLKVG